MCVELTRRAPPFLQFAFQRGAALRRLRLCCFELVERLGERRQRDILLGRDVQRDVQVPAIGLDLVALGDMGEARVILERSKVSRTVFACSGSRVF